MKLQGSTRRVFSDDDDNDVIKQVELIYECSQAKDEKLSCDVTKNIYQNTMDEYYRGKPFKLLRTERFFKLTEEEMENKFEIQVRGAGEEIPVDFNPFGRGFFNPFGSVFDELNRMVGFRPITRSDGRHEQSDDFGKDDFNSTIFGEKKNG